MTFKRPVRRGTTQTFTIFEISNATPVPRAKCVRPTTVPARRNKAQHDIYFLNNALIGIYSSKQIGVYSIKLKLTPDRAGLVLDGLLCTGLGDLFREQVSVALLVAVYTAGMCKTEELKGASRCWLEWFPFHIQSMSYLSGHLHGPHRLIIDDNTLKVIPLSSVLTLNSGTPCFCCYISC